jgi:phosphate-selective porin
MTVNVFHLKSLTDEQFDRVNRVGWDGGADLSRHANITMLGDIDSARAAWDESGYELVASVDTDDLEVAFIKTQNLDRDWSLDATRSSSVGDVFERDGHRYLVAGVGFKEIV